MMRFLGQEVIASCQREDAAADEEMEEMLNQTHHYVKIKIPAKERQEMRPITPPIYATDVREPLDHLQREHAAGDEEMRPLGNYTYSNVQ